jgi:hypothetical protein
MISFHADKHQYFNEDNEPYISVSGLFHLVEPEKDWVEIARKKSRNLKKYENKEVSVRELLRKWEDARNKGAEAGTIIHDIREKELLSTQEPTFYNSKCKLIPCTYYNGIKYSLKTKKLENNTVYPELIIYNHDYKVSGQSDKVIVTNKTINVHDYKTDAEIKRKAYSSEWKKADKLKPPVAHQDDCNFNAYSLKMSMYMYLLWIDNKSFKIGEILLEHLHLERDEEGLPILYEGRPRVLKQEQIKVPYLKREVKAILDWYKAGKLTDGR